MTKFMDTTAGEDFIASADSRETSREIMEAIAWFVKDEAEAEALWNGDWLWNICTPTDLWRRVTKDGLLEATDFFWGASGPRWWALISEMEREAEDYAANAWKRAMTSGKAKEEAYARRENRIAKEEAYIRRTLGKD